MLLLLNEREPPSPKSKIISFDTASFVSSCHAASWLPLFLSQKCPGRDLFFSGLYFFHHFHDNCSRAGQDEIAHCPVIHVENIEAIDRNDELANLGRKTSSKSYALDFLCQVTYKDINSQACKTSRTLCAVSFSALKKDTVLRINLAR